MFLPLNIVGYSSIIIITIILDIFFGSIDEVPIFIIKLKTTIIIQEIGTNYFNVLFFCT